MLKATITWWSGFAEAPTMVTLDEAPPPLRLVPPAAPQTGDEDDWHDARMEGYLGDG